MDVELCLWLLGRKKLYVSDWDDEKDIGTEREWSDRRLEEAA
jgi:hypothetical protein